MRYCVAVVLQSMSMPAVLNLFVFKRHPPICPLCLPSLSSLDTDQPTPSRQISTISTSIRALRLASCSAHSTPCVSMSGPSSARTSITTLSNRPGEFQHSATGMTSGSNSRDAGFSTRGFRRKGMERTKSLAELESGMIWKGSTTFSPGRMGMNLDKPPTTPKRSTSPAPLDFASSYGADADDEYRQPSGSATSPISITSTPSPATSPLPRPRARIHYSSPIPRTAFTPTRFLREGSAHNASPSPSTPFITNKQAGEEDRPIHPFFNRDFRRTKSVPLPAGPPPRANKPRIVAYYSSTSASSSQTSTQTSAQHSSQEHEAGPSSRLDYARDAGPTPGKGLWKLDRRR